LWWGYNKNNIETIQVSVWTRLTWPLLDNSENHHVEEFQAIWLITELYIIKADIMSTNIGHKYDENKLKLFEIVSEHHSGCRYS